MGLNKVQKFLALAQMFAWRNKKNNVISGLKTLRICVLMLSCLLHLKRFKRNVLYVIKAIILQVFNRIKAIRIIPDSSAVYFGLCTSNLHAYLDGKILANSYALPSTVQSLYYIIFVVHMNGSCPT